MLAITGPNLALYLLLLLSSFLALTLLLWLFDKVVRRRTGAYIAGGPIVILLAILLAVVPYDTRRGGTAGLLVAEALLGSVAVGWVIYRGVMVSRVKRAQLAQTLGRQPSLTERRSHARYLLLMFAFWVGFLAFRTSSLPALPRFVSVSASVACLAGALITLIVGRRRGKFLRPSTGTAVILMANVTRSRRWVVGVLTAIGIAISAVVAASGWTAFALIGPAMMASGVAVVALFGRLRQATETQPLKPTKARDVLPLVGGSAIALALGMLGTRAVLLGFLGVLGVMSGILLIAPVVPVRSPEK